VISRALITIFSVRLMFLSFSLIVIEVCLTVDVRPTQNRELAQPGPSSN
jgi:hypothetical protein